MSLWTVVEHFGSAKFHKEPDRGWDRRKRAFDRLWKTEIIVVTYMWWLLLKQPEGTWTERLNEYESFFLTVNIIHFITSCSGNMWHSPVRPKERTVDWNQKEERDTTREWREQMSISSGLARKKKRLRDLFGRIWHLECINKQLFLSRYERRAAEVRRYGADHPQCYNFCSDGSTPLTWLSITLSILKWCYGGLDCTSSKTKLIVNNSRLLSP